MFGAFFIANVNVICYNIIMANTYSYPHVEDYIEIISGYRTPDGKGINSIWHSPSPLLSLARYDVKILESFGEQSYVKQVGYTDKQAALAHSIVVKYERQLAKQGVDISPVKEKPAYRTHIRNIDRSTKVWIENDLIKLRFPYNTQQIESIRDAAKTSQGSIHFDRNEKVWHAALTEYNVSWCYSYAQALNFGIDPTMQAAMDKILDTEHQGFAIELVADDQTLRINNAPDSLVEYVTEKLGELTTDNLLQVVDHAPILGFLVEDVIGEVIIQAFGTRFWTLCSNRELKVDDDGSHRSQIAEVVKYAKETNRFPIFVYEPDMSDKLGSAFAGFFEKDQIAQLDKKDTITEHTRLIHTRKIPKTEIDRIPLLVSGAGLMYGGDRQIWIQNAEKIVYFARDVYNKGKQGRDICKLD